MKLGEVRKIASVHLQSLSQQKNQLENMLKQDTGGNFDRVEISRELKAINEEYQQTQGVMDKMDQMYGAIANAEVARQQSEALTEAAEDLLKILETFRRISKGDKVPPQDEKRLMEYSDKLYLTAKNMALIADRTKRKEHDSLWEEEGPEEESPAPMEVAAETEVGDPLAAIDHASATSATSTTKE